MWVCACVCVGVPSSNCIFEQLISSFFSLVLPLSFPPLSLLTQRSLIFCNFSKEFSRQRPLSVWQYCGSDSEQVVWVCCNCFSCCICSYCFSYCCYCCSSVCSCSCSCYCCFIYISRAPSFVLLSNLQLNVVRWLTTDTVCVSMCVLATVTAKIKITQLLGKAAAAAVAAAAMGSAARRLWLRSLRVLRQLRQSNAP